MENIPVSCTTSRVTGAISIFQLSVLATFSINPIYAGISIPHVVLSALLLYGIGDGWASIMEAYEE